MHCESSNAEQSVFNKESILSRLLLVRHGLTMLHKGDRFWGKTDIALSNIGIMQAAQLRARLARKR